MSRAWMLLGRARGTPMAITLLFLAATACAERTQEPTREEPMSFAIYTLSRGKGVPAEARQALRRAEAILEGDRERGVPLRSTRTRIGIEGESRLCVEYEDGAAGRAAYRKIEEIVAGVDLVRLEEEPCQEKSEVPPLSDGTKEDA